MSAPPKFFGLIWAFFVEEAVWDLFLEGSEAKFSPWAVWQRTDYRKRQVIVMQILSALLHENDRREMMADQQFFRRWLSTESGYEEELPSAVIIQEVIALLPKQNSSTTQTANLLSPAFQTISSKTRFLNCFTQGSQIPLTPFDLFRIAICDGQLLSLLEHNAKYPKFCCAAIRRYISQFLISPMEAAMHRKIETKYQWHSVFDVPNSDLLAANSSPSLPTKITRNGFNFHHPFPDLVVTTPRQMPLPSLFTQDPAIEPKKATVMIRKPSVSDDKFRKHPQPSLSSPHPSDPKKRKTQDDRMDVEATPPEAIEHSEIGGVKDATPSPAAQNMVLDQQTETTQGSSPKEIKSSPITPKPVNEGTEHMVDSKDTDHSTVSMSKSEDEKTTIPSPKPTAKVQNAQPTVLKKEALDAMDTRWEAKLQQFFKERAHALDGWLDKAIIRRIQESFDKNAVASSIENDVKSLLLSRTEKIADETSQELDNAVRSRCRKTLGLDSSINDHAADDKGKVDDAAGRFVREVWNAQLKSKEGELSESVSNFVVDIVDKHMEKFAQRLVEPMDQTIQTVFSRRLLAMEPKLTNLIDTRIAELWKSRMEKMSGLMATNVDLTVQQMVKDRMHKINYDQISDKQDAFSQNGATPTSQDHIDEIPDMLSANSRTTTSWH